MESARQFKQELSKKRESPLISTQSAPGPVPSYGRRGGGPTSKMHPASKSVHGEAVARHLQGRDIRHCEPQCSADSTRENSHSSFVDGPLTSKIKQRMKVPIHPTETHFALLGKNGERGTAAARTQRSFSQSRRKKTLSNSRKFFVETQTLPH